MLFLNSLELAYMETSTLSFDANVFGGENNVHCQIQKDKRLPLMDIIFILNAVELKNPFCLLL